MKNASRLAVVAITTLGSVLPVACLPEANAVSGCHSSVVTKVSPWGKTVEVQVAPGAFDLTATFRLGASARYWYCPNGSDPDKIKVTHVGLCATKWDNRDPSVLKGFEYNPYIKTMAVGDDKQVDPHSQFLAWGGWGDEGDRRCDLHEIRSEYRVWMLMKNDPIWTLDGWIDYDGYPNDNITWYAGGDHRRSFNPAEDPILDPFG